MGFSKRFTSFLQAIVLIVGCFAVFPAGAVIGEAQQHQDNRLQWSGTRQKLGRRFNLEGLLRGADLQSDRIDNTRELIEFIRSLKMSDLLKSAKSVDMATDVESAHEQPAILKLKNRNSPGSVVSKISSKLLPARATKAKAKAWPETRAKSQSKSKSKSVTRAKSKGDEVTPGSRPRTAGCQCSGGAGRISLAELAKTRANEAQRRKTKWTPTARPASVDDLRGGKLDSRSSKEQATPRESEPPSIRPGDDAKAIEGRQDADPVSATELVEKLLGKFKLVDRLVDRISSLKRKPAAADRQDELDPSYGFDLNDSQLNEPDEEDGSSSNLMAASSSRRRRRHQLKVSN